MTTGANTSRERLLAIMALVVRHNGAKGAAHEMGVSEGTVHGYVNQLSTRLGVSGQLAILTTLDWLRVPDSVDEDLALRAYARDAAS